MTIGGLHRSLVFDVFGTGPVSDDEPDVVVPVTHQTDSPARGVDLQTGNLVPRHAVEPHRIRLIVGPLEPREVELREVPPAEGLARDERVFGEHQDERHTRGPLRIPDLAGLTVHVGPDVDLPPPQGERLERLGALEDTDLEISGLELHPTRHPLPRGRPSVGELEGFFQGAEGDVEHDDDLGVIGVVEGADLGADPGELARIVTLGLQVSQCVLEDARGRVEDAVGEFDHGHVDLRGGRG